MLSKKEEYAIRAVLELAFRKGYDFLKVKRIASSQKIPFRFLEGILNQLRNAGLVESERGQNGGYKLSKPPGEITVLDVLKATGSNECITKENHIVDKNNSYKWDYAVSYLENKVLETVKNILGSITIDELIELEESSVGTYTIDYTI